MSTRCLCWLTRVLLGAMLLAVLAPAVSRALSRVQVAGDWVEVCTLQGMQWVLLTAHGIPAKPGPSNPLHALDYCGHCTLQADRFAPLLPNQPTVPTGVGVWTCAVGQFASIHTLAAPSPGARGPPLLS